MTARAYLFVSKATIKWCLARYLATDHPENIGAWIGQWPFGPEDRTRKLGDYENFVRQRNDLAVNLSTDPDPFLPQNSTFIDVSNWWGYGGGAEAVAARQAATMSPQAMSFMKALTEDSNVVQWAHVMDPELAKQWLKRAMKLSPAQIGELQGVAQFTAITDMWAAFGQYWKAMNIAPQGWAKYRNTWEYHARPANTQVVLRDNLGYSWPRPTTVPIWPRSVSATWYPENAPKYLGPWRWEAILANEQWGQARTGHTKLDANVTVLFGSLGSYKAQLSDDGTSMFGAKVPYAEVGGDSRSWSCQDLVIYGGLQSGRRSLGRCQAPNNELHAFWIDNAGMMSGGMNPVWMGVTTAGVSGNLSIPNRPWTNSREVQYMNGAADAGAFISNTLNDVLAFFGSDPIVNLSAELRAPGLLKTPGAGPNRRPRYLWGVTRCADSAPDVESSPAASFYTKFDVSGSRGSDWNRTSDGVADSIKVKAEVQTGEPRTDGAQTWRDGVLASIPPAGWGSAYIQWPTQGASWLSLAQKQSGSYVGSTVSGAAPYNIVGFSGFGSFFGDGAYQMSLVLWQPPPKRYVDMLWPLLMYLDSKSPQEIACEVKYDVMGKNGFSLRAMGGVLTAGTSLDSLDQAGNVFRENMQKARSDAQLRADQALAESRKITKLVTVILQTIAVAVVSAAASPAAGAGVAAGFALLNGAIALSEAATRTAVWSLNGKDVFGRPDGSRSTTGEAILGICERYSLYNIKRADQGTVSEVSIQMYNSMRRWYRKSNITDESNPEANYQPFYANFVEDAGPDQANRKDPYPVGYPAPRLFIPDVGIVGFGSLTSLSNPQPEAPPVRLRNLKPKPKKAAADGINPATLAAAAVAGLAVGALISEASSD